MSFAALQILNEPNVYKKLDLIKHLESSLLSGGADFNVYTHLIPARDIQILPPLQHPAKKGMSFPEGRARLMHDLASIELQAMELGLRTLIDFPDAPVNFREELLKIVINEAEHLELCLQEIDDQGFKWGDWPVHLGLWNATAQSDSLLDRILIVHRYLEGSGLDAGDTFMRRMHLIDSPMMKKALHQIADEEIGHVQFGSYWYRQMCMNDQIDPAEDFPQRMEKLSYILPRRREPISVERRLKAGFTLDEIKYLQNLRESVLYRG